MCEFLWVAMISPHSTMVAFRSNCSKTSQAGLDSAASGSVKLVW
jgi:hypothetical protein